MSNLVPLAVPPMSPQLRERLYGIFAWASLLLTTSLSVVGAAIGLGVDVPQEIPTYLAIGQTGVGTAWGFLGFVAKSNVPDTGHAASGDPDLGDVG